jgi:hypothetical protein
LPNFTEDEHLVRVGFMSAAEANDLVGTLDAAGVREDEVAIVLSHDPRVPAWLEVGLIENTACCWLRDAPAGRVARPVPAFIVSLPLQARDALRRVVERFGATLDSTDVESGQRCTRDGAELILQIFENRPSNIFFVIGSRIISRRRNVDDDVALMREFSTALEAAGGVKRA